MIIKLYLWHKVLTIFEVFLDVGGIYRHELVSKSILKREHTSFHEAKGVSELALKTQEVGERKQCLMMIEIFLQEPEKRTNVHGCLHLFKFQVETFVLLAFSEGHQFCTVRLSFHDLHSEELSRWSRPVFCWLTKQVLSLSKLPLLLLILLIHLLDISLLFLGGTFHFLFHLFMEPSFALFSIKYIFTSSSTCAKLAGSICK